MENRQCLHNILSTARRTMELCGPRAALSPPLPSTDYPPAVPTLNIPFPYNFTTLIRSKHLPLQVSERLLQFVSHWASQAQQIHRTTFQHTCERLLQQPVKSSPARIAGLASYYERSYETCMGRLYSILEKNFQFIDGEAEEEKQKPTFNAKYTPVLESYFQLHAYPSALERRTLAQKSGMTTRQIEVWFQNHRNRSKRGGVPLRRCESAHQHICLDALEKEVLQTMTPDLTEDGSDDEVDEISQMWSIAHPFTSSSPPHAFPARYRPSSSPYDPFPQVNGRFTFATLQWSRRPSTQPIKRRPVDMDELATLFTSTLTFREAATSRPPRTEPSRPSAGKAWYSATVTIPQRAPLPSFVKSSSTSNATSTSPHQRRFSPFPTQLASRSSPSSKPRLPGRLPSWSMPLASPSKTNNPPSRTASLESISSCDSSSSSSSLDELVTPPMTPGPLQGAELIFNDLFDNSLGLDFPNFSLPSTPFSFDASQAKMHGAFPSILSPFQYMISS